MLLQQFLIWWGMYFIFMCILFLLMFFAGREKDMMSLHDLAATIECTALGAFMAISHYYGLHTRYFAQKKHLTYIALTICFIGLFILLDVPLFCFQIGREILNDRLTHVLYVSSERVMYAYVPVVLVYMFFRNKQLKRKERKNSAKFVPQV